MIPLKQLPTVSPLTYDYHYHFNKVAKYYNGDFRDLATLQTHMDRVGARDYPREPVSAILKEQNEAYGCDRSTMDNITKLIDRKTCAVVTGQQVGLFSGPLYTIYKAITAIKLAEYLSQNAGEPVVPIFWLASDDHDFAEINHVDLLNQANQVTRVSYDPPASSTRIPAADILLTQDIVTCIQAFDAATQDSEFKQSVLSHLSAAYRAGESIATAFACWLTRLFKPYGLIIIDASHPDLKKLGAKVFRTEIQDGSPSTVRALESSQDLQQSGYKAQVGVHAGILNLFYGERERQSIHVQDGQYHIKGTPGAFTRQALLDLLESNPQRFSPNVLLRPLYQDALLPTVAYVGGPAEIAYFAQMKGIYDSFGMHMPVLYPRKTVTILEKKIDTVLTNYQLRVQDVWRTDDKLINEAVQKNIPVAIDESIGLAATHLAGDFEAIKEQVMAFDASLEKTVDMSLGKMNQQLEFLRKKVLKTAKQRDAIITQQLSKAMHNLYPNNHLQERVFNITPLLMKYGYGLMEQLYQAIDIDSYDHQIIKL